MSREDMQRTMDFILEQQAQFATNIQLLRETQTQLTISQATAEVRIDRIEEAILRTFGVIERITDNLDRIDGLVAANAEAQAQAQVALRELQESTAASFSKLADSQSQTEASMRALAEAEARLVGRQEHTDERLNTLINVVERNISKRTGGDSA